MQRSSVTKRKLDSRIAPALALVTGALFGLAATLTALRPLGLDPGLARLQWPLLAADAALFALLAALPLLGVILHPALIGESAFIAFAFAVGHYTSESVLAPVVTLAVIALAAAFILLRKKARIAAWRVALLGMSALIALAALIVLAKDPKMLLWHRVRSPSGPELRTFVFEARCPAPGGPRDPLEIEAGCGPIIPPGRARAVIALCGASFAVGAAAAAAQRRRIRPGPARTMQP